MKKVKLYDFFGNMLKKIVIKFFLVLIQDNECTFSNFCHDYVVEDCSKIRNKV